MIEFEHTVIVATEIMIEFEHVVIADAEIIYNQVRRQTI